MAKTNVASQNTVRISLKKIRTYYVSHIWCCLLSVVLGVTVILIVLTNWYLKTRYADYLQETVRKNYATILSLTQKNIQSELSELVQIGCRAATDEVLYQNISAYLDTRANALSARQEIRESVGNICSSSRWIMASCIASSSHIIAQTKNGGSYLPYYGSDTNDINSIFRTVVALSENREVPAYCALTGSTRMLPASVVPVYHLAFPVKGSSMKDGIRAILILTVRLEMFQTALQASDTNAQASYANLFLADQTDRIIYGRDEAWIGSTVQEYEVQTQAACSSLPCDNTGWRLYIGINERLLSQQIMQFYKEGLWLYLVVIVCALLILFFVITFILHPLSELSSAIRQTKEGNLHSTVKIRGKNEIWQLAGEFNGMVLALKETGKRVERENREKVRALQMQREAERVALESQINAHFIYNTLSAINYEAMEIGSETISSMIVNLSKILRYSMQKQQQVCLAQEVKWVEEYLALQKIRYEGMFAYDVYLEEGLEEFPCCKLMLQPFVENAIKHGFGGNAENGMIHICCKRAGDAQAYICISDNGYGMSPETLAGIQKKMLGDGEGEGPGLGIANVVSRMRLFYHNKLQCEVASAQSAGTTIIIRIFEKAENAGYPIDEEAFS